MTDNFCNTHLVCASINAMKSDMTETRFKRLYKLVIFRGK